MPSGTLVLVHLPHDVRLVLRKQGNAYYFDSWKRPAAASPDLFLDWKLHALTSRELLKRSFPTLEEAKTAFASELGKLAPPSRTR